MNKVYLGIGGNLGDRAKHLSEAIQAISSEVGEIIIVSSLYETKAWGIKHQPDFLNQVLLVETALSPLDLLETVLRIETEMGRIRTRKWYTRLIDIDVLFYDHLILETKSLMLPHPFITQRNFVLAPLAEIAGDFIHPVLQKSIYKLYQECNDPLDVYQLKIS